MGEAMQAGMGAGEAAELRARVARLEEQVGELQGMLRGRVARVAVAPPSMPRVVASEDVPRFGGVEVGRRESLESAFGAKVLSKVGVVLVLVGAAWFLKWAFDNRWVGAVGRVAIGLIAGAGVVVWSERFRKSGTPAFSYALKAVGSGVLYLSLWASFQLYHQVPAGVALAAMVAVTAWNAAMAMMQDSRLLAGYALLGAYLTPVLLSTGGDHEVFLFCYLASIALAVGVLLRVKDWGLLLLAVLPVISIFFMGWYAEWFTPEAAGVTILLALVLWGIFAGIPLVAREADGAIVGVLEPMGAAVFGALTMYSVLVDSGRRGAEAWVALGFAAVYLGASRWRRESVLSAVHLSLALSFLTVAIPLKATGHGITVGWLAEALAVFWLATLPGLEVRARVALQWLGIVALLLGVGGALVGPMVSGSGRTAFLNRDFATSVGAVVVLVGAMVMVRRWPLREGRGPVAEVVGAMSLLLLNVVMLFAMNHEISLWLQGGETSDFAFSGWMAVQGAGMLVVGFLRRVELARWIGLVLLGVTIVKMVAYDMRHLGTGYRVVSYLALGVLLMAVSFAYQKDWMGMREVVVEPVDDAESGR